MSWNGLIKWLLSTFDIVTINFFSTKTRPTWDYISDAKSASIHANMPIRHRHEFHAHAGIINYLAQNKSPLLNYAWRVPRLANHVYQITKPCSNVASRVFVPSLKQFQPITLMTSLTPANLVLGFHIRCVKWHEPLQHLRFENGGAAVWTWVI